MCSAGETLAPTAVPLGGGEGLLVTETYQEDHNTREYAREVAIMAQIRDTVLYHFEETSLEQWRLVTEVLALNNIKTEEAPEATPQAVLSTEQVYEYITGAPTNGSPVARYLEGN
ncbi:hypothetical protein KJ865_05385 [Myxococcota bacterium]|nr:hypothetical protein [Myxococcota bacterium]